MINTPSKILKKVWRRVSGIEARQLYNQLLNTQNELTSTQNELTSTFTSRNKRLHPFVAEALNLVAPNRKIEASTKVGLKQEVSAFTEFGSDKDTRHSYGDIYLGLLNNFSNPKILEIGVGSVNNFPYAGLAAGGGLKAFRKCFPISEITGLDIDPESIDIITSDGFNGYVVDQTSDDSLSQVKNDLKHLGPFDLIIDDGFHDPHANVRTMQALIELLSDKGTYVIEDVHESLINFWEAISAHLPGKLQVLDMREIRPGVDDNILLLITKR